MVKTDANIEYLIKCISSLKCEDDCRRFLEDLCSISELYEMSRRLRAARMLNEGRVYSDIAAETGLSTATISRVNRALKYGNNGFQTAFSAANETEN